jgi:hypothetical protein
MRVGRPTLEKCATIKKRREYEEELREIDPKNILDSRLRGSGVPRQAALVVDSDSSESDPDDDDDIRDSGISNSNKETDSD